ncbi:MAG: GxxExxY protein [Candidatus Portnoybacteria bacterium CG02_land_8_20_14_3_00_45_8]|uniref:GxxExxY protein n=1 Tax=Candidatus Portnoybacteria bacterium CG02_land_8_20_14_3_00_45_8 TaxID=1974807 RepID=A0A2M7D636_9BACT|nr:MAG: GxxExxY protein [Candidatus Portnoybacteria bacterium CG02_land_8_20_14_3_00_45_8]
MELIHKELTYKIIGVLYEVFNELGYGYQEKYYQKATALALKKHGLKFKEQVYTPVKFQKNKIGKYFLDFVIENKVVLEIKKNDKFFKSDITQLFAYLKATNLKLGLIANFTKNGVKIKRIANLNP